MAAHQFWTPKYYYFLPNIIFLNKFRCILSEDHSFSCPVKHGQSAEIWYSSPVLWEVPYVIHLHRSAAEEELAFCSNHKNTVLVNGLTSLETVGSASQAHFRVIFTDKFEPFREKVEDEPTWTHFTQLSSCLKSSAQVAQVKWCVIVIFLFLLGDYRLIHDYFMFFLMKFVFWNASSDQGGIWNHEGVEDILSVNTLR